MNGYGGYGGGGGGFGQPPGGGQPPSGGGGGNYNMGFAQEIANIRKELDERLNRTAGGLRKITDERAQHLEKRLDDLQKIMQVMVASRQSSNPAGVVRIEDIPGRRVPYVMLMDIPIGNNTTSIREQSVTISQEGPFVAVKRMATFQSSFEFQYTNPTTGAVSRYSGRSFGRYRPIHSAWDVNDAYRPPTTTTNPFPTGPGPFVGSPELTSTISGFRSMEFDGRIEVINAGSSYPRQNISVPSSMWSPQINAPQELGALDFFERGEIITVKVQPTHVNNPPAGNADGLNIFGITGWPFLAGQYDPHEGIVTPSGFAFIDGSMIRIGTDPITRLPDGILTIGWEGYRIIQPVGPVT